MPVRQAERRPVRIQLHGGDMPEKVPESRQAKQLGSGLDTVDPGRVQPVHAEPFDFRSCRDQLMKQPAERLIPVAGLPAQGVFFGAVPAEAAELEGFPVLFIPGDGLPQFFNLNGLQPVEVELDAEGTEEGDIGPGRHGRRAERLGMGRSRDMRAHRALGIEGEEPVLDLQALNGVGIVGRPDLGSEAEHAEIEAVSA